MITQQDLLTLQHLSWLLTSTIVFDWCLELVAYAGFPGVGRWFGEPLTEAVQRVFNGRPMAPQASGDKGHSASRSRHSTQ
jgi:hypothetical protein